MHSNLSTVLYDAYKLMYLNQLYALHLQPDFLIIKISVHSSR